MIQSDAAETQNPEEAKLPRRDWILLPLLSLLTVATMLGLAEIGARIVFPEEKGDACLVPDASIRARFLPNCSSRTKLAEGELVENVYNECGYPTRESCRTKPAGAIRIAVLGSSSSFGFMLHYDQGYTAIDSAALSRQCGRQVEFQNLGVPGNTLIDVYRRTGEALALKPDLLLLVVDPVDINTDITPDALAHRNAPPEASSKATGIVAPSWVKRNIILPMRESRAVFVIQHFMFENPNTYSKLYLLYGDNADYLRSPFTIKWKRRFSNLDVLVADVSLQAHNAGVPLVIMAGESAAQVALVNENSPQRAQPYAFADEVAKIGAKYGIAVVNPLPDFADRANPMSLFYVADGHPSPQGEAIIAAALDKFLLASGIPVFANCRKVK